MQLLSNVLILTKLFWGDGKINSDYLSHILKNSEDVFNCPNRLLFCEKKDGMGHLLSGNCMERHACFSQFNKSLIVGDQFAPTILFYSFHL